MVSSLCIGNIIQKYALHLHIHVEAYLLSTSCWTGCSGNAIHALARLHLVLVFKLVFKPSTLCSVHMLSCRGTGDESYASLSVWAHRSRCRQYRQVSGPSVMNAHALFIGEWMRERAFGLPFHFLNFFLFCPSKSNHDPFTLPLFRGGGHMAGASEQLGICNLLHSTLCLRGTRVINDPMISCRFNSYPPCLGHSAVWNNHSLGTHSQGGFLCEFACKCVCFDSNPRHACHIKHSKSGVC